MNLYIILYEFLSSCPAVLYWSSSVARICDIKLCSHCDLFTRHIEDMIHALEFSLFVYVL